MKFIIPKIVYDVAESYIDKILINPEENIELTDHTPTSEEVTDSK